MSPVISAKHLQSPEHFEGWCGIHDLSSSLTGNNRTDSCPVNIAARTTHTQSALEIDSTGHVYQTHHAGRPRQHALYGGAHHPTGKMCPYALLPE